MHIATFHSTRSHHRTDQTAGDTKKRTRTTTKSTLLHILLNHIHFINTSSPSSSLPHLREDLFFIFCHWGHTHNILEDVWDSERTRVGGGVVMLSGLVQVTPFVIPSDGGIIKYKRAHYYQLSPDANTQTHTDILRERKPNSVLYFCSGLS